MAAAESRGCAAPPGDQAGAPSVAAGPARAPSADHTKDHIVKESHMWYIHFDIVLDRAHKLHWTYVWLYVWFKDGTSILPITLLSTMFFFHVRNLLLICFLLFYATLSPVLFTLPCIEEILSILDGNFVLAPTDCHLATDLLLPSNQGNWFKKRLLIANQDLKDQPNVWYLSLTNY